MENEPCTSAGCGHAFYYHLDGSCWHDDNCTCSIRGRLTGSPDGYLREVNDGAMMTGW
jgi:hypothetical protein